MDDNDSSGVGRVDPTKNVLDLVKAESKYQDAMREAQRRYTEMLVGCTNRHEEEMRKKDQLRRDDLAKQRDSYEIRLSDQRDRYETRIAHMLSENMTSKTDLLAKQQEKSVADASDRFSKLEQFRWESGGKASGIAIVASVATFFVGAVLAGITMWAAFKP